MSLGLLLRWLLNSVALFGIAYFAPRLGILPGFFVDGFEAAVFAAGILAVLNLTVGPIIKILTLPITCLTFGIFTLVINALMMLMTARIVRGFDIGGFINAVMASIIYAIVSTILNMIFNPKED